MIDVVIIDKVIFIHSCCKIAAYYELKFGDNEKVRFYTGNDRLKPRMGFSRSAKNKKSQVTRTRINSNSNMLKSQWENYRHFNDCIHQIIDPRDYAKNLTSLHNFLSENLHCEITNATTHSCENNKLNSNCHMFKKDSPFDDNLSCELSFNNLQTLEKMNLDIRMKTSDKTIKFLSKYDRNIDDPRIGFHGNIYCNLSFAHVKKKHSAVINFKHKLSLTDIVPSLRQTSGNKTSQEAIFATIENRILLVSGVVAITAAITIVLVYSTKKCKREDWTR